MATSNVKEFPPIVSDIVDEAFELIGRTVDTQGGLSGKAARRSLNTVLGNIINDFVPQWLLREVDLELEIGKDTYELPIGVEDIRSAVLLYQNDTRSRKSLFPVTAEQWNWWRYQEFGEPFRYWVQRTDPLVMHFRYIPNQVYTVRYMAVMRPDIVMRPNEEIEIPYRWRSAISYLLAVQLAMKSKDMENLEILIPMAEQAYERAKQAEGDDVPLEIKSTVFEGMKR